MAIPDTAKLDDYAVGAWMRRQRKADNLTNGQAAKLDALDCGAWSRTGTAPTSTPPSTGAVRRMRT
ncbi:helicase associated domain-containing protein [Streptomyces novaecaesareae]|uniref:helicase associated domain-containing protein n=1 Tax=Streptomyces novaecaesareae TaxID=68244 RepID=UPI003CC90BB5